MKKIIEALKAGLEYAKESLVEHDETLGRTTEKNRITAWQVEIDIEKIQVAIERAKERQKCHCGMILPTKYCPSSTKYCPYCGGRANNGKGKK